MSKIALFGTTGKTGAIFLQKALDQGHQVQALVRTPSKLNTQHPALSVIQGDVLDPLAVRKTIAGCELVMSLFGHVKGSPTRIQTEGTQRILEAMSQAGVRKIVSLSGGGLPFEKDEPKFPDKLIRGIMKLFAKDILDDAIAHAAVLADSDTEWIIVRGPRLTLEPGKGAYRVGWVGVNASTKISREDLADFLLTQVHSQEYLYQMPFVSE